MESLRKQLERYDSLLRGTSKGVGKMTKEQKAKLIELVKNKEYTEAIDLITEVEEGGVKRAKDLLIELDNGTSIKLNEKHSETYLKISKEEVHKAWKFYEDTLILVKLSEVKKEKVMFMKKRLEIIHSKMGVYEHYTIIQGSEMDLAINKPYEYINFYDTKPKGRGVLIKNNK